MDTVERKLSCSLFLVLSITLVSLNASSTSLPTSISETVTPTKTNTNTGTSYNTSGKDTTTSHAITSTDNSSTSRQYTTTSAPTPPPPTTTTSSSTSTTAKTPFTCYNFTCNNQTCPGSHVNDLQNSTCLTEDGYCFIWRDVDTVLSSVNFTVGCRTICAPTTNVTGNTTTTNECCQKNHCNDDKALLLNFNSSGTMITFQSITTFICFLLVAF